jgi:sugar O-acyltransferase (sialic acid O-acetyltransferase NeuD family)
MKGVGMAKQLVILGTGGSAYDILDIVEALDTREPAWEVVGFLDDAKPAGSPHLGYRILGRISEARRFEECFFINTIGSDRSFRQRPEIIASTGLGRERFATLIHPAALVSSRARIGRGVVINPGVVVGGEAIIGDQVMICPGCIVGHETTIGDSSTLAPGAVISGLVVIEPACYVGARAVVRQKLRIGTRALVGMGAVVVHDVGPGETVIGVPARPS